MAGNIYYRLRQSGEEIEERLADVPIALDKAIQALAAAQEAKRLARSAEEYVDKTVAAIPDNTEFIDLLIAALLSNTDFLAKILEALPAAEGESF